MIKSNIKDPATGLVANVVDEDEKNALVVATRPLKTYDNKLGYFSNSTYGIEMNQDGAFGGTAIEIHDGTDDGGLWTAQDVVGSKTVYDSTDQNHTTGGTKSIKCDDLPVGEIFEIDKGSDQVLTNYIGFTMWIYVDKDWKIGDAVDFYGWLSTGTPAQVGTKVDLSDYFDYTDTDTWHKIYIPFVDMGLTGLTIDTVRFEREAKDGKAKFYIDDIQIEQSGTPVVFTLEPDLGTWLHVKSFQIVVADDFVSTVVAGTQPSIPYDNLLGVALTSGIDYKRIEDGITTTTATLNKFVDFMSLSNATITGSGGDLTNSWVAINVQFNEDVILKSENADKMTLTINDDLSALLYLRVGVGSKVEKRNS